MEAFKMSAARLHFEIGYWRVYRGMGNARRLLGGVWSVGPKGRGRRWVNNHDRKEYRTRAGAARGLK